MKRVFLKTQLAAAVAVAAAGGVHAQTKTIKFANQNAKGHPIVLGMEKFAELVDQGWTDALRTLHPDERVYTFWHYWRNSFERDAGIRIDHFLLSPASAKALKSAGVDRTPRGWEKTSDHAPTWVELET